MELLPNFWVADTSQPNALVKLSANLTIAACFSLIYYTIYLRECKVAS